MTASRPRRPWWIPYFLGPVPVLEPALYGLLGRVALSLFFEQYDLSILTSALKFIAQDLHMAEHELGTYLGMIRLGSLPALLVVPFADRIGRRAVFLGCLLGVSLGSLFTAFAQTALQFALLQMATRIFIVAGSAVAFVIVTEEFPAEYRGWAIGMLGALGSCGHGLGAALFAAINRLPFGWRALYAIGVAPLFVLPLFRRRVVETARFTRHRGTRSAERGGWFRPLVDFARTSPGRAAGLALAGGLVAVGEVSVFQFTGYFTQTVHGWTPGEFSTMVILGGGVGIIGHTIAGRLGDRIGRRRVGMLFLSCFPFFASLFYRGAGWWIPAAWVLFVFCGTAGEVILRALSTELFPTSHRGTAAGWLSFVETLGWTVGLGLIGFAAHEPGDIARFTSLLSFAVLLGALALFLLPETRQRELEAISPEPAGAGRG